MVKCNYVNFESNQEKLRHHSSVMQLVNSCTGWVISDFAKIVNTYNEWGRPSLSSCQREGKCEILLFDNTFHIGSMC